MSDCETAAGRTGTRVSMRATRPRTQEPPRAETSATARRSLSPVLSHQGELMDVLAATAGSAKCLFFSPPSSSSRSSSIVEGLLSCRIKKKKKRAERKKRAAPPDSFAWRDVGFRLYFHGGELPFFCRVGRADRDERAHNKTAVFQPSNKQPGSGGGKCVCFPAF